MWTLRNKLYAAAIVGVLFVAGLAASGFFLAPREPAAVETQGLDRPALLRQLELQGFDVAADRDLDGLVDVLENFAYGSDPQAFSTTGNGIPDGWLADHGFDPALPGVEGLPAAAPPTKELPEAYGGAWPAKYAWTVGEAYAAGRPADWPADRLWGGGFDPNDWRGAGTIPAAWLARHNLTREQATAGTAPDRDLGILDSYTTDTDPRLADTDDDGLADSAEVRVHHSDPRRASTSGAGPPDGWLVRYGLDVLDERIGSRDFGKGLSVNKTWAYDELRFGRAAALAGKGLDPTKVSTAGNGVPDGWLLAHGLDPLEPEVAGKRLQCASDDPVARELEQPGEPDDLCIDVAGAYRHARPAAWDEAKQGPWRHGLDPTTPDYDRDGLSDSFELRGHSIRRSLDLGTGTNGTWARTASDPRRADTDSDGLGDGEEVRGLAKRGDRTYAFGGSDPAQADTAFSGLSDLEKVLGLIDGQALPLHADGPDGVLVPILNLTRADSAGAFLTDAQALRYWRQASANALEGRDYRLAFPGSDHESYEAWVNALPSTQGQSLTRQQVGAKLGPGGDIDGDGLANLVDADPAGDGVLAGWKRDPRLLRFSDFPNDVDRAPFDPANPDTDGDDLPDAWELMHGRASAALDGYDLDPAAADSDQDGTGDGEENLDEDVVRWTAYSGPVGSLLPEARQFAFTNRLERDAGTDPRARDENGDGLAEGWAVFWSTVYPGLVQADQAGSVTPTAAEIAATRDRLADPLSSLGPAPKDNTTYLRFVTPPPVAQELDATRGEAVIATTVVGEDTIATIRGKAPHTFDDDERLALNPYLRDTDRDGMPDAWEALYFAQCGAPDPTQPDGGETDDADNDGLSNLEEFELAQSFTYGTDPCLADTDLDKVDDGEAVDFGANPLAPGSAVSAPESDLDEDGLKDRTERGQSDPLRADTAFSGLLDGATKCMDLASASEGERAREWLRQGIAHRDVTGAGCTPQRSSQTSYILFLGSAGLSRDLRTQDAFQDGVPDGWAKYHELGLSGKRNFAAKYQCAMPEWWGDAQKQLGPWWWGVAPNGACTRDLDFDGLDDLNGEDPLPAASQRNMPRTPVGTFPAALGEGHTASELHEMAQGYGDCAGNPTPCRAGWQQASAAIAQSRVPAILTDLAAPSSIDKEVPFTVTGTLRARCGDLPCAGDAALPNRAVVVRLGAPTTSYAATDGSVLGLGFTDAEGRFQVQACLCATGGSRAVPGNVTALGVRGGTAAWDTDAATVAAGTVVALAAHAYSSAAFPGGAQPAHPQWLDRDFGGVRRHASESATAAVGNALVEAGTKVDLQAPALVTWSDGERTLHLTARLADASGRPVAGQAIRFDSDPASLLGAAGRTATTVVDGSAVLDVTVPAGLTGAFNVTAAFAGAGALAANATKAPVRLQAPSTLSLSLPSGPARVGQPYHIHATLRTGDQPVPGVVVRGKLGAQAVQATTALNGSIDVDLVVTGQLGARDLALRTSPTPQLAAATAQATVQVLTGSRIESVLPTQADAGGPLVLTGRLSAQDGSPLQGLLTAELGGASLGSLATDSQGLFNRTLRVPDAAGAGPRELRVRYGGTPQVAGADLSGLVDVNSRPALAVDPATGDQGSSVTLVGELLGNGQPLGGQVVRFFVAAPATTAVPVPADSPATAIPAKTLHAHRLGDGTMGLQALDGSVWRLTNATGDVDPATNALLQGLLRADGKPDMSRAVEVVSRNLRADGSATLAVRRGDLLEAVTDLGGQMEAAYRIPADAALGALPVAATFAGSLDGRYSATTVRGAIQVTTPVTVVLDGPAALQPGNNTLRGRVLEAGHPDRAVPDKPITVQWPATFNRSATTDGFGRFEVTLPVTGGVRAGETEVRVRSAANATLGAADAAFRLPVRLPSRLAVAAANETGLNTTYHATARLLDAHGGVPGNVTISFLGRSWTVAADGNGSFAIDTDVPAEIGYGVQALAVRFAGDRHHDAAQWSSNITLRAGARLAMDALPDSVRPGQAVAVTLRLTDEQGQPLAGRLVNVRVGGDPVTYLGTTAEDGTVEVAVTAPAEGSFAVTASFVGSSDLAASSHTSGLVTVAPVRQAPVGVGLLVLAGLFALATVALLVAALRLRMAPSARRILYRAERRIRAGDAWTGAVLLAYRQLERLVEANHGREERTVRDVVDALVQSDVLGESGAIRLVQLVESASFAGRKLRPEDALSARRLLAGIARPEAAQ